jgi:hypothetical protein
MRLIWNSKEGCFEAEFQNFQTDLDAVKAAGFKTTGPPEWKWYTCKIEPLDKLRENRPASGLTILEDALDAYNRIKREKAAKDALLAELKAAKKENPNSTGIKLIYEMCEQGFKCVQVEGAGIGKAEYVPLVWSGPRCVICKDPVYFYEKQEPPTCGWCEGQLDDAPELF